MGLIRRNCHFFYVICHFHKRGKRIFRHVVHTEAFSYAVRKGDVIFRSLKLSNNYITNSVLKYCTVIHHFISTVRNCCLLFHILQFKLLFSLFTKQKSIHNNCQQLLTIVYCNFIVLCEVPLWKVFHSILYGSIQQFVDIISWFSIVSAVNSYKSITVFNSSSRLHLDEIFSSRIKRINKLATSYKKVTQLLIEYYC